MVRQPDANESARGWYRQAMEKDPSFARAFGGLAISHAADVRNQWVEDGTKALAQAEWIAQTAQQIDPSIPEVYRVLGYVDGQHRRLDSAPLSTRASKQNRLLDLHHSVATLAKPATPFPIFSRTSSQPSSLWRSAR